MIEVFNTKYKAVSNIYVHTIEDEKYTYPAPLYVYATIEDEQKNLKNQVKFRFSSYYDSILTIDFHFSAFMYLLTYDYHIVTLYIEGLEKEEITSEVSGHGGVYNFMNTNVLLNLGEDELYDRYKKTTVQA